jgi:hypothetical protein
MARSSLKLYPALSGRGKKIVSRPVFTFDLVGRIDQNAEPANENHQNEETKRALAGQSKETEGIEQQSDEKEPKKPEE